MVKFNLYKGLDKSKSFLPLYCAKTVGFVLSPRRPNLPKFSPIGPASNQATFSTEILNCWPKVPKFPPRYTLLKGHRAMGRTITSVMKETQPLARVLQSRELFIQGKGFLIQAIGMCGPVCAKQRPEEGLKDKTQSLKRQAQARRPQSMMS